MKTLLRHTGTGQYFHSLDSWTPDRGEAHDFGLIHTAVKFAKKLRVPGLELILDFDKPQEIGNTPFEIFWRRMARGRHSHHSPAGH